VRLFPRGVFSRTRRDWDLANLTYGSYADSGGASPPFYSLNNNSIAGNSLALYGILAFCGYSVPLMALTVAYGLTTPLPSNTTVQNVNQTSPAHDGYVSFASSGGGSVNRLGIIWWADGRGWLENGGAPLLILPPKYQAVVTTASIVNNRATYIPTACTYLWGYYV
jgi:hypothetical protein